LNDYFIYLFYKDSPLNAEAANQPAKKGGQSSNIGGRLPAGQKSKDETAIFNDNDIQVLKMDLL
jgi:hypothetical protein